MDALKRILLVMLYPVAALFLVFPHVVGHLFHTRHGLYFGLLAMILCLVNGYAGYMQLFDGMDAIIDFQLLCLAGALYFPFHFLITSPFQELFEDFHQKMLTAIVGPEKRS